MSDQREAADEALYFETLRDTFKAAGRPHIAWPCACCQRQQRYDTDYFMVHNKLWARACKTLRVDPLDLMCFACIEKGIGRKLRQRDLTNCLVNDGVYGFDKSRLPA